ncbi:MAG TPA: hypothetical protein VMU24_01550 [Candidatus Acidoferrales bacterium]|nr:hypothetical protein [Candidatus Acidoferrales bacterium]
MTWWKLPVVVLGLGGVGAVMWALRSRRSAANSTRKHFQRWNEAAQQELVRLQDHLCEIANAVNPGGASHAGSI